MTFLTLTIFQAAFGCIGFVVFFVNLIKLVGFKIERKRATIKKIYVSLAMLTGLMMMIVSLLVGLIKRFDYIY